MEVREKKFNCDTDTYVTSCHSGVWDYYYVISDRSYFCEVILIDGMEHNID